MVVEHNAASPPGSLGRAEAAADPARLLGAETEQFRARFDLQPFGFRHALAQHPLFEPARRTQLVGSLCRAGLSLRPPGAPVRDGLKRTLLPGLQAAREVRERLRKRRVPA